MLSLDQFIQKYNGVGIDYDGVYSFQCVDLVQEYNKECLGNTPFTGNAIDIWTTYPTDNYDKVENSPANAPRKGDIVVWGNGIGQFGHIDVCAQEGATTDAFTGFDQNWPLGSVPHLQAHTYFAVLGWLQPKNPPQPLPQPIPLPPQGGVLMPSYLQTLFQEQSLDVTNEPAVRQFWGKAIDFDSLQQQLTAAKNQKNIDNTTISGLQDQVTVLKNQLAAGVPKTKLGKWFYNVARNIG